MLVLAISRWNKMNKSTKLYFTKYKKKEKEKKAIFTYLSIYLYHSLSQIAYSWYLSLSSQSTPPHLLSSFLSTTQRPWLLFSRFMITNNLFLNLISGLEGDMWPLRKDLLVFFVCVFYSTYCFKIFIQYLFRVGKAMDASFYFTLS